MTQAPVLDDPYSRPHQVFPTLSCDMIDRLRRYGVEEVADTARALFRRGDRNADFFVVLDGLVDILRIGEDGADSVLTTHEAGQFTGELDQVSGRMLLVEARPHAGTRTLRIAHDRLAQALAAEPDIGEIVMRAFILRRMGFLYHGQAGIVVIGPGQDADVVRIMRFANRNGYPYRLADTVADPDALDMTRGFGLDPEDLPAVLAPDRTILRNPSTRALAERLGVTVAVSPDTLWDVVVVGAGPAGLAAATYAASEGLSTLVVETVAPGGQAGTSSKIENYLGFPTGISGQALAGRAQVQAQKFGARIAVTRAATELDCDSYPYAIRLDGEDQVQARSIVIATGARYRKIALPDYGRFEGHGIHYAATAIEGALCAEQPVVVVGGGNSAGQAAMYLSRLASHVHILVRGSGLAATMSDYLVQRIASSPRITLHPHSAITALEGDRMLRVVTWRDDAAGRSVRLETANLFVMIGAEPNTDWLQGCIALDEKGFVVTGQPAGTRVVTQFETDRPGIFAVGDVRAGSVKRVASGVGEGSVVVQAVHRWLEDRARV